MFALDASTGKILWRFAAGSSVDAGPAIVDGTVYWGSGYAATSGRPSPFTGNDKFYAFESVRALTLGMFPTRLPPGDMPQTRQFRRNARRDPNAGSRQPHNPAPTP